MSKPVVTPQETKNFNVGEFIIQFQSVVEVPEISNAFFSFLKKEHNHENWEFIIGLRAIEQLLKKKNQKKINKQAFLLSSTFIEPKSPKELDFLPEEKKKVLEKLKTLDKTSWNLEESPTELFEEFRKVILIEYKNEPFKRFIRTEECLKVKNSNSNSTKLTFPISYLKNIKIIEMYYYQELL